MVDFREELMFVDEVEMENQSAVQMLPHHSAIWVVVDTLGMQECLDTQWRGDKPGLDDKALERICF